jgi:hypothetical protein
VSLQLQLQLQLQLLLQLQLQLQLLLQLQLQLQLQLLLQLLLLLLLQLFHVTRFATSYFSLSTFNLLLPLPIYHLSTVIPSIQHLISTIHYQTSNNQTSTIDHLKKKKEVLKTVTSL